MSSNRWHFAVPIFQEGFAVSIPPMPYSYRESPNQNMAHSWSTNIENMICVKAHIPFLEKLYQNNNIYIYFQWKLMNYLVHTMMMHFVVALYYSVVNQNSTIELHLKFLKITSVSDPLTTLVQKGKIKLVFCIRNK